MSYLQYNSLNGLCTINKVYMAAVAILVTSWDFLPDVLSGIVRLQDTIIQYYDSH